jgi:hypothetical protein
MSIKWGLSEGTVGGGGGTGEGTGWVKRKKHVIYTCKDNIMKPTNTV